MANQSNQTISSKLHQVLNQLYQAGYQDGLLDAAERELTVDEVENPQNNQPNQVLAENSIDLAIQKIIHLNQ